MSRSTRTRTRSGGEPGASVAPPPPGAHAPPADPFRHLTPAPGNEIPPEELLQILAALNLPSTSTGAAPPPSHTLQLLSTNAFLPTHLAVPSPTRSATISPGLSSMPPPPVPAPRASTSTYTPQPTRSGRVPRRRDPQVEEKDRSMMLFNEYLNYDWPSDDDEEDDPDFVENDIQVGSIEQSQDEGAGGDVSDYSMADGSREKSRVASGSGTGGMYDLNEHHVSATTNATANPLDIQVHPTSPPPLLPPQKPKPSKPRSTTTASRKRARATSPQPLPADDAPLISDDAPLTRLRARSRATTLANDSPTNADDLVPPPTRKAEAKDRRMARNRQTAAVSREKKRAEDAERAERLKNAEEENSDLKSQISELETALRETEERIRRVMEEIRNESEVREAREARRALEIGVMARGGGGGAMRRSPRRSVGVRTPMEVDRMRSEPEAVPTSEIGGWSEEEEETEESSEEEESEEEEEQEESEEDEEEEDEEEEEQTGVGKPTKATGFDLSAAMAALSDAGRAQLRKLLLEAQGGKGSPTVP
ncbi:fibronectin type iii [Pseudohyphozyma bogoriensis]|nr:fibronectin type iii [Pseudohyphozyma bogoriensis]